ncbi:MAG TPA: hypothetical protein VEH27_05275 [Methylomirabilota bacterium]|nr:hypothetical protein [Methylomirabilota bacterium]
MKHIWILCACFLLSASTTRLWAADLAASDQAKGAAHAEADQIYRALFERQFIKNNSGQKNEAAAYYLQLFKDEPQRFGFDHSKGVDPSDAFMESFANHVPPVRKASQARVDPPKGVLDKETGARGLLFRTGPIKPISETKVEVAGGYFEGLLSASHIIYTLAKVDDKWKVTSEQLRSISKLREVEEGGAQHIASAELSSTSAIRKGARVF